MWSRGDYQGRCKKDSLEADKASLGGHSVAILDRMFQETTHDDVHNDWQGSKTRFHRHKASVQPSSCCLSHQPFDNANKNWDLDGDDEQFDLQEYCNLVLHIVDLSLVVDSYLVGNLPRG